MQSVSYKFQSTKHRMNGGKVSKEMYNLQKEMCSDQQVLQTDLICSSVIEVWKLLTFNIGHKPLFKETFQK